MPHVSPRWREMAKLSSSRLGRAQVAFGSEGVPQIVENHGLGTCVAGRAHRYYGFLKERTRPNQVSLGMCDQPQQGQ